MYLNIPRLDVDQGNCSPVRGCMGKLCILPISMLCLDLAYQRTMTAASARHALRIAEEFDWTKFIPLIGVMSADEKQCFVVDGGHRAAAAKARGITKLPVYCLDASVSEAASAFAAINGAVTRVTKQDIYRAQLAAGDPQVVAMQKILDVAGVTIVSSRDCGVGQSASVEPIKRALAVYGGEILMLTLQCIVETGDGNAGLIVGATINGIARALLSRPELTAQPSKVMSAIETVNLRQVWLDARLETVRTGNNMQAIIMRDIRRALDGVK